MVAFSVEKKVGVWYYKIVFFDLRVGSCVDDKKH